jgi:peptidyl-prolyl cis-trans isomerase D
MLAFFRRHLNSWAARVLFLLLVAAFGLWGIADVVRNLGGGDGSVATVAGRKIQAAELDDVYRRQLAEIARMTGTPSPGPEMRLAVAERALDSLVTQAALGAEVDRLGLAVPDDALRQAVFAIPAFRGPGGQFDRTTFQTVLANNSLTEQHFLELMRADLATGQLMGAVQAGIRAPDSEAAQIYQYQHETRTAETADFPFADAAPPPAPDEAVLRRWYDNHPKEFSAPEYRRIKAVILSPETLAKQIPVSDADLRAAYAQGAARFQVPEKRSAQVLLAPDEAAARKLAEQWRGGADWAQMQQAAQAQGATAAALDDAARGEFPAAELAQAVFAAAPDAISDPVHSALGWYVVKVVKVTPGTDIGFEQARGALRDQIAQARAADQLYDRATKAEDALAGGAGLDELPDTLGLAAVTGTLDAQGNTKDGTPAPIPGSSALRQALVAAAFATHKGDPPRLTQAPDHSYFAVTVEDTSPAARAPFDSVKDAVLASWRRDAVRHAQNAAATKLMTAVQDGQSLADAATVAGVTIRPTPPISRDAPPAGVPQELLGPLFAMKPGEITMVETPDGFLVARLAAISDPDPKADPAGLADTQAELTRTTANDIQTAFTAALRVRAQPRVNQRAVEALAQP